MKKISAKPIATVAAALLCCEAAHATEEAQLRRAVNEVIPALMKENNVPGMAVAITVRGERYILNYGLASQESGQKVTNDTLFEIGSISKTFTATLASYAEASGALSLSDDASKYLPALAGTKFDGISLLDLGTYTAGGLPLQFPESVTDQESMLAYYKNWRPAYPSGKHRVYSNPSIGLFGYLAAESMGEPFADLMEKRVFPAFGLTNTYIRVPQSRMDDYAHGHSKTGKPVRVNPGVLDAQSYGVKTTAVDLLRYLEANMNAAGMDEAFQKAIAGTHVGYYKVGAMTQGLGWEMYAYPTKLDDLLAGNSSEVSLKPNKVERLVPPSPAEDNVWINKTGSTGGFGAYVAFIPAERIGIVMLANKAYPNAARVKAAHQILTVLDSKLGSAGAR